MRAIPAVPEQTTQRGLGTFCSVKFYVLPATARFPPEIRIRVANSGRCNVNGITTNGNWCQETFASGLRNPFRIAFDPNASGTRFFINDVGQNVWEEIDEGIAGADYGWNIREGHCANGSTTDCGTPPPGLTNPIFRLPTHFKLFDGGNSRQFNYRRRIRSRRCVVGSI